MPVVFFNFILKSIDFCGMNFAENMQNNLPLQIFKKLTHMTRAEIPRKSYVHKQLSSWTCKDQCAHTTIVFFDLVKLNYFFSIIFWLKCAEYSMLFEIFQKKSKFGQNDAYSYIALALRHVVLHWKPLRCHILCYEFLGVDQVNSMYKSCACVVPYSHLMPLFIVIVILHDLTYRIYRNIRLGR